MSFSLLRSGEIEFKIFEFKYLNSNNLNQKFVTVSPFFVSMLEVCGLVYLNKHNELCPASQFRLVTPNIKLSVDRHVVCHDSHSCHFTAHEPNWQFLSNTGRWNSITM